MMQFLEFFPLFAFCVIAIAILIAHEYRIQKLERKLLEAARILDIALPSDEKHRGHDTGFMRQRRQRVVESGRIGSEI